MARIVEFKSKLRQWPRPPRSGKFRPPRRQPPAWWPLVALIALSGILYAAVILRSDDDVERSSDGNIVFRLCVRGNQQNCVVDGDTIRFGREIIRLADINAPEGREARCPQEEALGRRATQRLLALLNEGPFDIAYAGRRDQDQYGRDLRIVTRNGRSLGDILVAEGLAEKWTGRKGDWCNR